VPTVDVFKATTNVVEPPAATFKGNAVWRL